jgi:hypothetical protein
VRCRAGLGGQLASTHSYKHEKYPWLIGFRLLLSKPILVYPMGGDFVPYPYPWGQFSFHTRTLSASLGTTISHGISIFTWENELISLGKIKIS